VDLQSRRHSLVGNGRGTTIQRREKKETGRKGEEKCLPNRSGRGKKKGGIKGSEGEEVVVKGSPNGLPLKERRRKWGGGEARCKVDKNSGEKPYIAYRSRCGSKKKDERRRRKMG